jgi:hypothetical protein
MNDVNDAATKHLARTVVECLDFTRRAKTCYCIVTVNADDQVYVRVSKTEMKLVLSGLAHRDGYTHPCGGVFDQDDSSFTLDGYGL